MRFRAQSYQNLDGTIRATPSIPWYWSLLAIVASTMILGGYLMLPVTSLNDTSLRISNVAIGVFALAILLAGFCATALACISVHDHYFQAAEVFRPALVSCVIGFLTVFYNFIVSSRYTWTVPAALLTAAAAITATIYGVLLHWTFNKIKARSVIPPSIPIQDTSSKASTTRWQAPEYYQNYIKNMFPTAAPSSETVQELGDITEDEMQRQQMLMLLLKQDQPNAEPGSTFRIEWQDQEHETPLTATSGTSFSRTPKSMSMKVPGGLKPWDGVWRGVAQPGNPQAFLEREQRRRQIEMGT